MQNLTAFLQYHAARRPEAPAMLWGDATIGYADLLDRALRLSGWLAGRGIGEGSIVALVMKNSPAFLEIAFAASHLGAVLLPVNYRLAAEEIAYITGHAGAGLVLADDELAALAREVSCPVVELNAAMQSDSRVLAGYDTPPAAMAVRGPGDLFRLMYTSGTTDRPKGVTHDYGNLYWKCMDHVVDLQLTRDDRLCVVGPMYHVGAFDLPGIAVLWVGGSLTLLRDYTPEAVLATIEKHRATGIWMPPIMTNGILNAPDRGRWDVSSLRWCVAGGDRTPESRIREFTDVFANARYVDAYGLTESCSGDTLMEAGREIEKIGSVGRATAHVEIEIRDDEGTALPAGSEGEICLRGAKVTKGYWKDPDRTAAAFWPQGWFRTGDVGYLDAEGFLYLTDRKKDMIISGGENIASSEVERVVYQLPQVSETAVVGRPDPKWGERPVAVVVLKAGGELDYPALEAHCRKHLAGFKVPKELHIVDALPRNPSGKVLKRVLRDRFRDDA
ncbi:acyl-CoA synthetase [Thalassobaculum fulvum]|uniref:3-methylmercaptopropionyl-CoA ligase n=1 Tax=Thalassobaculum fulvum TaxID=1633335 RepID=A0A919CSG5_9PROT|nr:AMP-binding protein [Thalassobaculum fulvum]GHD62400.1 acyl-CoA synthetase [Thalassobaculum fulvum]